MLRLSIYLPTCLSVCLSIYSSFFCFKILVVIACQNLKGTNQRSAIYIALSTTNPAPGPRGPRGLGSVFNKGTSLSRLSPSPSFALRNTLATSQNAAIESVSLHLPSISTYQLERSGKIRKIRKDQAALAPFTAGFNSKLRGLTRQAEPSCFWWDFQMRSMTCTRS